MSDFKRKIRALFQGRGVWKNGDRSFAAYDPDKYYRILNHVLIIVSSLLLVYTLLQIVQRQNMGLVALLYRERQLGVVFMSLAIVCITISAALRTRLPFFAPTLIPVILFAVNCLAFLRLGFGDGFSGLWIFAIPPLIYFTAGRRAGFAVSLAIFAGMLVFLLFPRLSIYYYTIEKIVRIITVYILLFFSAHIYEYVSNSKGKKLEKLNELLKAERDEFAVMKDSLKAGLFLMDKDLIIQERYSRTLEETFGISSLAGKKFTDLLTASLTSAEISALTGFFEMVRERRFDTAMLEDINPLQELKYILGYEHPEKILRCTFTPIDRPSGETLIIGNIEDITSKVTIEKQLKYEEAKHEEEMTSLFEVLQIDPDVFNDFIEDAEYEFETINNILKNTRISSKDTLTTIYQSIHAIKANAIILELNNYGRKLHEIETYIKELQQKPEVIFDDMLDLTVRIDGAMRDKDKFSESIEKLKFFVSGRTKKSAVDILIESVNRTAERTAGGVGKKVKMDTSGVDGAALEQAPRRLVKEVLLQLVRNAVVHGIESPEYRVEKGKKETGNIAFSLKREGEKIHIVLRDDGQGLDFEKIRDRAEKMHLIKKNEKIDNKNLIYQAIFMPGFSTAGSEDMHAGRGVGLDLVYSRIKENNGTIRIQTEAGKGSIFNIFLPAQNVPEDWRI